MLSRMNFAATLMSNQRFNLQQASAQARNTPEAMPRGAVANVEFMGWIGRQWEAWARERGFRSADEARLRTRGADADFGAWLARTWP